MPELTPEQGEALARVRRAAQLVVAAWPDQAGALLTVIAAHALTDVLDSPAAPKLVEVINEQLRGTPYMLTDRPAN